jgi:transposase-like protein
MTDDDTYPANACPDCGSFDVYGRYAGLQDYGTDGQRYRCEDCGATFDDPLRRERECGAIRPDCLAAELVSADPEEVFDA